MQRILTCRYLPRQLCRSPWDVSRRLARSAPKHELLADLRPQVDEAVAQPIQGSKVSFRLDDCIGIQCKLVHADGVAAHAHDLQRSGTSRYSAVAKSTRY
jgi:hypothetical protein